MKKLFLLIVYFLVVLPGRGELNDVNKRLVREIREMYNDFDKMQARRHAVLDSMLDLRNSLGNSLEKVLLTQRIGDFYKEANIDSALFYWTLAMREAESEKLSAKAAELHLALLSHCTLVQPGIQAVHSFLSFDTVSMDKNLRKKYWANCARLNYYVQEPCDPGEAKTFFQSRAIVALDSLIRYYPPESAISGIISARLQELQGDKTLAIASLLEVLPYLSDDSSEYEDALTAICEYYSDKPAHRQLFINKLFELARSTMKRGLVRPSVMAETGRIIYEEEDRSLGKGLIIKALSYDDGRLGRMRGLDYSKYVQYLDASATQVRIGIAVFFVLLLIGIIILIFLLIRNYRLRKFSLGEYKAKVKNMRRTIDDLESVSAGTCALAFHLQEQSKEFGMYVSRKLKAGQIKELCADIDSGSYISIQKEKFFAAFDESFFSVFPDFLEQLNSILIPGKELSLLSGGRMPHELRIAACMRLGITDSSRLSDLLGLSINTIYAYRNRLKCRAIDRSAFENQVRSMYRCKGAANQVSEKKNSEGGQ